MQHYARVRPKIKVHEENPSDPNCAQHHHYHPRRSNIGDLLTSLLLLPPGSADVQSTSFPLTPIMLILVIAGTKAIDHAAWLTEKLLKGTMVTIFFERSLSDGRTNGALLLMVSE
jgi:hypothetical protein